jgi:hypothetical protein
MEKGDTPVRPIRPTTIEFENDTEMQRFINYATSNKKTENEVLNSVRERRKKHKPAKEIRLD